jgi:hypothetical protein
MEYRLPNTIGRYSPSSFRRVLYEPFTAGSIRSACISAQSAHAFISSGVMDYFVKKSRKSWNGSLYIQRL